MKKVMKLIAMTVMAFGFIACSNTSQQETQTVNNDVVTIALTTAPDSGFDPCFGWGRAGNPLIQSTLLYIDSDMKIENDLSTGHQVSDDGLILTFTLRDDVVFSDGVALTADDVVFTFLTAKESGSSIDLSVLERVVAIDSLAVEFHLKRPQSTFLYNVSQIGIVPLHYYGVGYGDAPIGSGPYTLLQWIPGQQAILENNPLYYGEQPQISRVNILFMSEDSAFAAAKKGDVDVAITNATLAKQTIAGMKLTNLQTIDNRGLTLPTVPDTGDVTALGQKIGNDVTSDIAIRRSLSYGIDREQLVADALNGFGIPAYSECDGMPWSNPIVICHDSSMAISILEESGWIVNPETGIREKNGVLAEFTILYNAEDGVRQALSFSIAEQAKALGISIVTEGTNWTDIENRMYSNAVLMGWGAENPMETYLLYHSSNKGHDYYNPENYENAIVDAHIEEALQTTDYEASMEAWKKVQWDEETKTGVSALGDVPFLWLVNTDHLFFVKDGLSIGEQKIHPHGHDMPVLSNLPKWTWETE